MTASGDKQPEAERRPRHRSAEDDDVDDEDSESESESEGEAGPGMPTAGVGGGGGFGGVTVSRSREVRVGPSTFYNAPIHIENLVLAGAEPRCVHEQTGAVALNLPSPPPPPPPQQQQHNSSNVKPHNALCPWLFGPGQSLWRLGLVAASVLAAAAAILILVLALRRADSPADNRPARPPQNTSGNLTVIPHSEWSAEATHDRRVGLALPVRYVIVSHTFTEECAVYDECVRLLRALQRLHVLARGYYDLSYNFVVGGDGYVYEGRGWNATAERRSPFADNSVTLSLAGRFTVGLRPPSDLQMAALQALIRQGVRQGALAPGYRVFALCQVEYNQSPGSLAYQRVQQLPHWALYSGAGHAGNCTG